MVARITEDVGYQATAPPSGILLVIPLPLSSHSIFCRQKWHVEEAIISTASCGIQGQSLQLLHHRLNPDSETPNMYQQSL